MDGSTLLTIAMVVMMVVMIGGALIAGDRAIFRRRQHRDD